MPINLTIKEPENQGNEPWEDIWKRREKWRLPNGELRLASMDMELEFRAYRTIAIKAMTLQEIARIHAYELTHMWDRFMMITEMRKVLNNPSIPSGCKTYEQLEWLKKECLKHKPDLNLPEIDRDGMLLHHKWDLAMKHIIWELPETNDMSVVNKLSRRKR